MDEKDKKKDDSKKEKSEMWWQFPLAVVLTFIAFLVGMNLYANFNPGALRGSYSSIQATPTGRTCTGVGRVYACPIPGQPNRRCECRAQ